MYRKNKEENLEGSKTSQFLMVQTIDIGLFTDTNKKTIDKGITHFNDICMG